MDIDGFSVDRVVEWVGLLMPVTDLFPTTTTSRWRAAAGDWPVGVIDRETLRWRGAMQTWIIRGPHLVVLVDTGVGNGRERPQAPALAHLQTRYLDDLAEAGVTPDAVDVVVDTHVHYDHVGWNTRWMDGRWVPTFPRARYLIPRADVEYYDPRNAAAMRPPRTPEEAARFAGARLVFDDSIRPVLDAGQAELWSGHLEVAGGLQLDETAGHTPGSSVLWLGGRGGAVFVGDLIHSPLQAADPEISPVFDLDAGAAARARRRVLDRAAREERWIFPAHLAGPGGFRVEPHGSGFDIVEWAALPPV